ncbi:cell envelope integrity protein TolA [Pseudochrobactrum sp. HB0163]|uniref:cell envelope integrity protein TolA n=1 Tax=Pseudochrobactrum sp. HB0163 TaxID=3450708 RepID=UPI003F6DABC0
MKAGLTSSTLMHVIIIGWGLFTFSSPKPFDMTDTESFPVDIVPIEDISQVQMGEKKAAKTDKPAPKPTERPKTVEQAENAGDSDLDLKTPPMPNEKPKPVETAEAAKPAEKPAEKPEPLQETQPQPKPEPVKTPEPVKQPEPKVEPKPEPKAETKPDPVAEAIEKQPEEDVKLPDRVPAPEARPKPKPVETAKAEDNKKAEKKPEKPSTAAQNTSKDKDAKADEIAALLNREKAAGGGAKRSTDKESFGGKKTTGGKLSQTEMDALKGQISDKWSVPAGVADASDLRITVKMRLKENGDIDGTPEVTYTGGDSVIGRAAADSARRAVLRAAPYNLPRDKYDTWATVIVNFDPSDMF